jgi:CheY-like chemotaxis protein
MALQRKRSILVVDDEPTWLLVMSRYLTSQGYSVQVANSGAEALSALASFTPDLILSDVRMPDMNGFDLVDMIKKQPATRTTPVVFISAIDDFDARRVARDVGAVDYLVKPLDEHDVGSLLKKHLPR